MLGMCRISQATLGLLARRRSWEVTGPAAVPALSPLRLPLISTVNRDYNSKKELLSISLPPPTFKLQA